MGTWAHGQKNGRGGADASGERSREREMRELREQREEALRRAGSLASWLLSSAY